MSNRRLPQGLKRKMKAPSDPEGACSEQTRPPSPLSFWRWTFLALKVLVGLILVVSAVGALAYGVHRYAQTTPRFAIVHVELSGSKRLVREDVLASAGVTEGDNLFSLETDKAEQALLASPWISSAQVIRRLPGTIRIQIVEREARAIAVIAGKNFLVSEEGTPFKELGRGDPHDLPVVTGISPIALARDRRAELARLVESLGLLRDYERLALAKKYPVEEVHLESSGTATLVVGTAGTTLHLGASPWKRKLLRAERILSKTRHKGGTPAVVFLDNEAHPERIVVRVQ